MNILSIENLEKTVDSTPLFTNATMGLEEGEKVGIVGHNGSGKSTFLKVLAGRLHADNGTVSMKNGSTAMLLEQSVVWTEGSTVLDFLYEADSPKTRLLRDYSMNHDEKSLARIESEGLWNLEVDYRAWLGKFGFERDTDALMDSLSGGERKKAALARLFAIRPSIMLLDEPTNHLDIRTVEILESELAQTSASVILVTHDRYILNSVCTTIWELDRGRFYTHPGNFEAYLERRAERLTMMQKEQDRLASILRRELVWLQRGPQARTGKDKNRKDRIEAMLSSVHNVQDVRQTSFSSLTRRLGKKILELDDVSACYGERSLFSHFTYSFKKGDRIGVVGDNGSGKSTLLDIIAGVREPDCGLVERGVNTFISYYDQTSRDLKEDKSALEYIQDIAQRLVFCSQEISAERLLELFGFSREKMRVAISAFSGGEKRRLYLVSKLASNPNFLLLDEPTNDLDMATMENLEEYLSSFEGCCVVVSHDRAFLNCTCSSLFALEDGKVLNIPTTYSQWSQEKKRKPQEEKRQDTRPKREKKGLSFKEQKELEALEVEIESLEEEKAALEESFATVDNTLQERNARYKEVTRLVEEKTERYFELAERA